MTLKRVFNMLNFILRLFQYMRYIVKRYSPNIVIASSTYPLDVFPAYLITKKSNVKLIFEVHDFWSQLLAKKFLYMLNGGI